MYMYAKDLNEPKHELLIKKSEDAGTKHFSDPNVFTGCSNTMDDVYKSIDDYNPVDYNPDYTQSYFSVPKYVRLNLTYYLIMKINNKKNYKILQLIILQILITKIS